MSMRIDLDFHQGLAHPAVEQAQDGALLISLTRGREQVVVQLSLASLEALSLALTLALAWIKRC
ncbi:MAG: hypothetical protein ACE5JN_08255 [Candidatus Methylomirabilia bacterium]